jgi:CelD/BcsL family acetyltransferase involved in cellulose biosynthesis
VWSTDFMARWAALLTRSDASVYHEPAVVRAWAETHGHAIGAQPLIGIATHRDGPEVLLIFIIRRNSGRHVFRRTLSPVGDAFFGYHDPLVSEGDAARIDFAAFWEQVRESTAAECDHGLIRHVHGTFAQGRFSEPTNAPSPVLSLSGCADLDAVLARCSGEHRKDIRRQSRRLTDEVGPPELWVATTNEGAAASEDFRTYFLEMYGRAWRGRATGNMFERAGVKPFADRIVEEGVPGGWAKYMVLRAGSRPVAWHLGLQHRGAWYWWIPTHDATFKAYSPGRLLLAFAIEHAIRHDISRVHFLTGDSGYKLEWRPERIEMRSVRWYSPTIKGNVLQWYDRYSAVKRRRATARTSA